MRFTTPRGKIWPLFDDMASQPHLLVAGATGSGKSVVINGIIANLLHRLPGDQRDGVKLILIDPKRVELSAYRNIPHTICYASEPEEMLSALAYAMAITEKRYAAMQKARLKKFDGGDIYVIIDEWADLMTTQKNAVMPIVQRLGQIGRAARVHVILATQTPIAKILPTEIKCNFDARVGLRTRSDQDSRNIVGFSGLENLPRYGQGYYMKPGEESYWKIPYVTDDELDRLVRYWERQNRGLRRLFVVA